MFRKKLSFFQLTFLLSLFLLACFPNCQWEQQSCRNTLPWNPHSAFRVFCSELQYILPNRMNLPTNNSVFCLNVILKPLYSLKDIPFFSIGSEQHGPIRFLQLLVNRHPSDVTCGRVQVKLLKAVLWVVPQYCDRTFTLCTCYRLLVIDICPLFCLWLRSSDKR